MSSNPASLARSYIDRTRQQPQTIFSSINKLSKSKSMALPQDLRTQVCH
ncbi:hypothetical protein [Nostoc sp. FACHB-110]|nr:hypothetical protein [Nostoc sp. FACHB-110]MBD2436614.1 hypothetical protein [Nostoc sp. FACHB-110]